MIGCMENTGSREVRFWTKVCRCVHSQSRIGQHYADCSVCCWPWLGAKDAKERGKTRYVFDNQNEVYAYRVAWRFAHASVAVPTGNEITHSCDRPPCCNPAHLETKSHLANQQDMAQRGRSSNGQHGGFRPHKLTWGTVDELRALAATQHYTCRQLAAQFGVSAQTISDILCGRSWGRPSKH